MRTVLALVALLAAGPAWAVDVFLFDLLKRPDYRKAYERMLAADPALPAWLTRYNRTSDGPSAPATDIKVGSRRYELADVCKPHDCVDNTLHVVFDPMSPELRAWGRLTVESRTHWIGAPPPDLRRAVEAALQ